jgi:hypothetical protein
VAVAIIGRDAAEEERQGDDELLHGCVGLPARRNVRIHKDTAAARRRPSGALTSLTPSPAQILRVYASAGGGDAAHCWRKHRPAKVCVVEPYPPSTRVLAVCVSRVALSREGAFAVKS